jgi:DNA-nicking Smr family endonuclease
MGRDHEEDPPSLEELLSRELPGVMPLADRGRVRPPRRRRTRTPLRPPDTPRAAFEVERFGERVEGRERRVDPRLLDRLRSGTVDIGIHLDLHGRTLDEARSDVEAAVARALAGGSRCLLVVHGRGLRSGGGPVLKEALPGWLTAPPLAARVAAFTSAPPRLGGAGALLVLLR